MAVREIKTSIKLDGEKAFEAELRAISQEMRVNRSEMRALQSGYDITDDKMGNLTRQAKVLRDNMDAQRAVVNALEREYRDTANTYGDTSQEAQGMAIKLNNARNTMYKMVKDAQDLDREIEELGRDSTKAGRQIRDGVGDGAEDAARSMQDMMDEMRDGFGSIKSFQTLSAVWDVGEGIANVAQGIAGFVQENEEYSRRLSFLEQNARTYGLDFDFVKAAMVEVTAVTGETEGAIEGLSNLMASGFDTMELATAISALKGAVISFPDTLKFESLADGLQETIATGSATGQYAELLERMGYSLDDFNNAMAAAATEEEKQQIALAYLQGDLQKVNAEYSANNTQLIAAAKSTQAYNDAMARLATTIRPFTTQAKGLVTDMINSTLDAFEEDGWGGLLGHILNIRPATTSPGDLADYYANKEAHEAAAALSGTPLPVVTYEDVSTESTRDMAQAMIDAAKDVLTGGGLEAGQQMGDQMAMGLAGETDLVVTQVAVMVDQINNELSRVEAINLQISATGGVAGMTGALSGGKGVAGAVIELDGRKVGQMITPYINQNSGRLVTRTVQTQ